MKAGSKPQHSIKIKIGLLHFASDWILQFDHLDNKLVIPSFITVSQLRPDIVIYSISTKTVILLKLTCHCEENIWGWHNKKFVKYHSLSLAMVSNGWSVHWFPIKVGARGYCSVTVKSCIMRLGFCANLVKFTLKSLILTSLKSLSLTSLKASFQIWLSWDSRKWENSITHFQSSKEQQSQHIKKTSGNPDHSQSVSFNYSFGQLQTKIVACWIKETFVISRHYSKVLALW